MFLSQIELCLFLNIDINSTDKEIESKYKNIIMKIHPDRIRNNNEYINDINNNKKYDINNCNSIDFIKLKEYYTNWKNKIGFYSKPYDIVKNNNNVICRCGDTYDDGMGIVYCNSCSCYIVVIQ
ncbi:hypothetical protein SLOPH_1131 [Spraguea lophii 42_110]|uniref:J domain-containing protein n=1 Tax=Spraguea lophii (strain 42_110) TaxID=1358809 RepID=S7XHG3_SPRLO|nr:hypothetical protein SLOPH_1131 [Spraguea lophii 42_110]